MNNHSYIDFGTGFERIFIGLVAILAGAILIYLAVMGPLITGAIKYKTADDINNQLIGQDLVNLVVLASILIAGGVLLLRRKSTAKYLLLATPLFLIYYAISYTIGWEWSSPRYSGNNERYFFYFLFILIAALLIMLYCLSVFPKNVFSTFKKKSLLIYSILFVLFLLVFAGMWIKEVLEVIKTGTTRGYDIAPTAFWLVRVFDLGFSIPLGLLSVYLLWTRAARAYPLIYMFYGFFFTQILAVNAMGWMMFIRHDPAFALRDLVVFSILALIIVFGFVYVHRNYKLKPGPTDI
ncbi:MAG: hypothetical protein OP8BY_1015 [Candidatus Saccharicenans subterraneus]|uniref:Uncharacterized protein n=1 Tax=Candidatus Saccharicenans subterraneus TaxID=2508984 RepID=A0A3E2BQM8_9BACT|nr:MAG: hypothetical protein OP8BY_1015 [Candidatus Saccharicenans subterraneum]